MASKTSSSSTSVTRSALPSPAPALQITGEQSGHTSTDIQSVIDSLKKQVISDRCHYVKKKMEENKQKLSIITNSLHDFSMTRTNNPGSYSSADLNILSRRQEEALYTPNNLDPCNGDKDESSFEEENTPSSLTVLFGSLHGGKNAIRPIKLPEVERLPPYTTWIFLDRNQRMTEDQSVVGRRRIYYDPSCGEALICSDSEDELADEEEDKREFGNVEEYIIRMTIQEVGCSEAATEALAQCLERSSEEIRARYKNLIKGETDQCIKGDCNTDDKVEDAFLEKDLDAALDSFDNLFCRRCLVFDCRLHGCSQDLVFPAEKQPPWSNSDEVKPCGNKCFRLMYNSPEENTQSSGSVSPLKSSKTVAASFCRRRVKSHQSDSASSNAKVVSENSESEVRPPHDPRSSHISSSPMKSRSHEKSGTTKNKNKRVAERVLICIRKRQKKMMPSDTDSIGSESFCSHEMKLRPTTRKGDRGTSSSSHSKNVKSSKVRKSRQKRSPIAKIDYCIESNGDTSKVLFASFDDASSRKEEFVDENIYKRDNTSFISWKVMEKSLFAKGVEIFGRNSCLIARNLLNGMKSCMEVYQYMNMIENNGLDRAGDRMKYVEGHPKGNELRSRSRFLRRRGRVRRLKYTWKSAGYHSIRKRITERKDQPCKQYNPCGCQSACGKQCPCILNGTCCEKYCGCPKMCKNRFRGCHCAKSQCRSRQCPCFAADRECDPDVCRNCWVGCGDGSLGGPTQRGDNYECRNMKLLLKQQQRVLLGKSDVSGWGAFLKNSVGKHEYLGEYTGELISHREADKRGKIYDRENSSFLFNLNDQFVLDAYRKGDKLKFANHSPDPNCYAKVIMVAGDHRVGIFAKEKISAGEELFYDYRYEPDRAPAWARKPESSGSKREETHPSSGRAKETCLTILLPILSLKFDVSN